MRYLIQENLFREFHNEKLIETLDKFGLEYELFNCPPFQDKFLKRINEIDFEEIEFSNEKYWIFGSVLSARIGKGLNLYPGSIYNLNHDVEVYGKHYGANMLNADGLITKFSSQLSDALPEAFFARPTGDTKAFNGGLFMKSSWYEFVEQILSSKHSGAAKTDTIILVAPLKTIYREIRCWCVKGKIITASQYKINGRIIYEYCDEPEIISFAQSMVDIYQPAEAFVIDVCITDKGLKVVEINCVNCAGFYYADIQKLITSIEENF